MKLNESYESRWRNKHFPRSHDIEERPHKTCMNTHLEERR